MDTSYIDQVRAFNRFYTSVIGLLDRHLPGSKYSLPEARVLYEISSQSDCNAKSIMSAFTIDKGYLSRILLKLRKNKLITTTASPRDGRSTIIALTSKGLQEFDLLNESSNQQIKTLLKALSMEDGEKLTFYLAEVQRILTAAIS